MGTPLNSARIAIYARFSSDKQSDASIEDQVHRAQEWIRTQGGDPERAQVLTDFAVSGASMDRPGMRSLEDAIRRNAIDLVLTESVDRISRDVGDADRFRKLLMHHDVALECLDGTRVASGKSDALMFGIRALFAEQYRLDLADKTRRGLEGRARVGAPTGAVAYGYRIVTEADGTKRVEIDEERAAVVRRMFTSYAQGKALAAIATELNAEGVTPPRAHSRRVGIGWMDTAIRAMLLNERYIGRWTYGEREWVKAPGSNARRPKERRGGPLLTQERPELALVDASTWAAVQARFSQRDGLARTARVNYPLSGILYCSLCGGLMTCVGGKVRRYGCVFARKRGTCANRMSLRVDAAEDAFFRVTTESMRQRLPRVLERAALKIAAWARSRGDRGTQLERRARQLDLQAANIASAIARAGALPALVDQLAALETERKALQLELAGLDRSPPELPSVEDIAQRVTSLERFRSADPDVVRTFARAQLKDGRILCTPVDRVYQLRWAVSAWAFLQGKNPGELGALPGYAVMVAGARYAQCLMSLRMQDHIAA